ncbi:hypothetical protein [Amycolatopsis aidingensis]|uniref:hypothetical protein n=1 Tax=Amycolatopsis aidingensis TaxID=2842453 RepID=UPI001C0CA721|nr:hypothetical protein [Amycolatopsis aidingensis]
MATPDEIERRVEDNDAARSAKRAAAAKRVGELAQRRADVADQLADIERELGDVLAESTDVIGTDELAKFTDIPLADLNQWLDGRKTTRTKRKKSTGGRAAAKNSPNHGSPPAKTPTVPEPATPRSVATDAPARVHAEVT